MRPTKLGGIKSGAQTYNLTVNLAKCITDWEGNQPLPIINWEST